MQKIEIILEDLKREFAPLKVFRFGSRAVGDSNHESDYDFVVVVKHTELSRLENMTKARALVIQVTQVSADVFVYDQAEFDEYKFEGRERMAPKHYW